MFDSTMVPKPPTAPTSVLSEIDWLAPGASVIVLVPTGPLSPTNVIVAVAVSVALGFTRSIDVVKNPVAPSAKYSVCGRTGLPFESTLLYAECRDE